MRTHEHICLRCGEPITDGAGTEVTLHGDAGHQHPICGEFYRGTNTHYVKAPAEAQMQEVYSHDWGDGVTYAFNVTNLRWRALRDHVRIIDVVVDRAMVDDMMVAREMRPEHALAVYQRRIRTGTWDYPGILVYHPDRNGSLIIDGNHRYVARAFMDTPVMRFYLFDYDELGRDVIKGVNAELLRSHVCTDTRWEGN